MSTPASSTLSIPLSQTTTLSPKHQALCRRSGLFNLAQVLCKSPLELRSILRLSSVQDAEWILDQLAAEGCETRGAIRFGFDARDKGKGRERDSNDDHDAAEGQVSTGDCHLDRMLRGGLTAGMLTELVGESSSGKSQLATQMAAYTALGVCPPRPHDDGGVSDAIISEVNDTQPGGVALLLSEGQTQGAAFVKRITEIVTGVVKARRHSRQDAYKHRRKKKRKLDEGEDSLPIPGSASSVSTSDASAQVDICSNDHDSIPQHVLDLTEEQEVERAVARTLDNVHIARVNDVESLEHVLQYTLPALAYNLLSQSQGGTEGPSQSTPLTQDPKPSGTQQSRTSTSQTAQRAPLRLIILDSLPALFYDDQPTSMNAMVARSKALCSISDGLKRVASIGRDSCGGGGGSAVLVINHVSDAFDKDIASVKFAAKGTANEDSAGTGIRSSFTRPQSQALTPPQDPPLIYAQQAPFISGLLASFNCSRLSEDPLNNGNASSAYVQLVPPRTEGFPSLRQASLGHVWNNCVNARIMLNKTGAFVNSGIGGGGGGGGGAKKRSLRLPLRKASVVFAPHLPPSETAFVVTEAGVIGLTVDQVRTRLAAPQQTSDENQEEDQQHRSVKTEDAKAEPSESANGGRRFSDVEDTVWTQFDLEVKGEDLEAVMGEFE